MKTTRVVRIGLFACLTVLGALISFPTPLSVVPVSLQTPCTLSAGFVLGPKDGAISQLLYLLVGAVGLPVLRAKQAVLVFWSAPPPVSCGVSC